MNFYFSWGSPVSKMGINGITVNHGDIVSGSKYQVIFTIEVFTIDLHAGKGRAKTECANTSVLAVF